MITAVDTCVLVDVLLVDEVHTPSSVAALAGAGEDGPLIIAEIVYAELVSAVRGRDHLDSVLDLLGISVVSLGVGAAYDAGRFFAAYRRSGGARSRILADFLIAAHALTHADRLLTRDRGFYREYFAELPIMDAAAEPEA
jgi:predicted nucleic acid-binding protein